MKRSTAMDIIMNIEEVRIIAWKLIIIARARIGIRSMFLPFPDRAGEG